MKVLFSGPSLSDADRQGAGPDIIHRGPARNGDLLVAVDAGATAIGLVDGLFGTVPAVWHKEILHALSLGASVAGGASMGALRAAECAAFGMVGIGAVHRAYADGTLLDDAAVAQVHAPTELGHAPLSEAAVNVEATVAALAEAGAVSPDERDRLLAASRRLHFTERTLAAVAATAVPDPARRDAVLRLMRDGYVDLKRADARAVLTWLVDQPARRARPPAWTLSETSHWRRLRSSVESHPP